MIFIILFFIKKELFNSIESIHLDKLESSDNSYKKSSPPPGFEMKFPDQII